MMWLKGYVGQYAIDGVNVDRVAWIGSNVTGNGGLEIAGASLKSYLANPNNAFDIRIATRAAFASATAILIEDTREVWMPYVYSDDISAKTTRALYIASDGQLGYDTSSIRYKTNITEMVDSDVVQQLRPVCYNRIDGGKEECGLIAEEVELIMPEITTKELVEKCNKTGKIVTDPDGQTGEEKVCWIEETDNVQSVEYRYLIPYLIKEIQNIMIRILGIEDRITELETENQTGCAEERSQ